MEKVRHIMQTLQSTLWLVGIAIVVLTCAIAADIAYGLFVDERKQPEYQKRRQEKKAARIQKEVEASEQVFFIEDYRSGFDSSGGLIYRGMAVPQGASSDAYRKLDELADTAIFENTKES